jgi:terminase large subunit-like protein
MRDSITMNTKREIAYRLDATLWAQEVLGVSPQDWQAQFLRAQRGASILVLTARQVGKTTVAAWGMAHTAIFKPGSLSVVACPRQQQSAEAIRKVREMVLIAGAKLVTDNVYGIELANGSRVLALPGSDESIRGLTVDGWILVDEAARVPKELVDALRPMRARCPHTRLVMLSTAWSRTDQFWSAWVSDDPSWLRLQATVDKYPDLLPADFLERERRQGEDYYKREYLGIPSGGHMSPFTWDMYERAIHVHVPRVPPGQAFSPPQAQAVPIINPFQHLKSFGGLQ